MEETKNHSMRTSSKKWNLNNATSDPAFAVKLNKSSKMKPLPADAGIAVPVNQPFELMIASNPSVPGRWSIHLPKSIELVKQQFKWKKF